MRGLSAIAFVRVVAQHVWPKRGYHLSRLVNDAGDQLQPLGTL